MKKFLRDFLKLFANSATVICLILASFLLMLNLYHHREININYYKDFSKDVQYLEYQGNLKKAYDNINSVNVDMVKGNRVSYATTAKDVFNSCYSYMDKSAFNDLSNKKEFSVKDIYKYNTEMFETLSNKCLFTIKYNYDILSKNHTDIKHSFASVSNNLENSRVNILAATDYMISEMESNSSYYFMTDLTRNSIYNRNVENMAFTVKNYLDLSKALLDVSNWYSLEFGGNK